MRAVVFICLFLSRLTLTWTHVNQSLRSSTDVVSEEWLSACAEAKAKISLEGFKHGNSGEDCFSGEVHRSSAAEDCPAAKRARLLVPGPAGGILPKRDYVVVLMVQEPEVGSDFYKLKEKCKQVCKANVHAHCSQFAGEI